MFSGGEADELLEFVEGEGSCILVYDAGSRLYDRLCERVPGEPCRWQLDESEAAEMRAELEDCADTPGRPWRPSWRRGCARSPPPANGRAERRPRGAGGSSRRTASRFRFTFVTVP